MIRLRLARRLRGGGSKREQRYDLSAGLRMRNVGERIGGLRVWIVVMSWGTSKGCIELPGGKGSGGVEERSGAVKRVQNVVNRAALLHHSLEQS